jgi:hypothetical protein
MYYMSLLYTCQDCEPDSPGLTLDNASPTQVNSPHTTFSDHVQRTFAGSMKGACHAASHSPHHVMSPGRSEAISAVLQIAQVKLR